MLAAVRTHVDHHVKLCESSNGGKTWHEKGPLTLPMQHPADLIALTDECLLLTYGIRNRGLMGIGARISLDAGETWRPPWVIHQFGDQATDIGYPSTVALDKKGNLLTAFYTDYEPSLGKRAGKIPGLGHEVVDQGLATPKLARFDLGWEETEALSPSGSRAEFLDEIGFDASVTVVLVVIDKVFEPCFHPLPELGELGILV